METHNFSNSPIKIIALDTIKDNLLRLDFYSESHLEELTKSIERDGLLEALIVYKNVENQELTILNGHYRIRSLKRLCIKEAPCRLLTCDDSAAIGHYLSSFLQKNTMTPLEEGHIILGLLKKGYALEKIGNLWGKSTSWACRRVKLLSALNEDIKNNLKLGKIHPRTAQELTRLPQGNEQKRILAIVLQHHLTKDETAKLIDRWLDGDENARNQIENEFKESSSTQKKIYISSPQDALKTAVNQCNKALLNLSEYMKASKEFQKIWPWEEYSWLCRNFEEIAIALDATTSKGRKTR